MKITLGDATTTAPDIKKLDAYLKRKFDNDRVRVVARLKKKDSAEVYVGEEYIGVLFFDEKDARSSFFELPILALDLDEPGLLKGEGIIYGPISPAAWPQACDPPVQLIRHRPPVAEPVAWEAHRRVGRVDAPFVEAG